MGRSFVRNLAPKAFLAAALAAGAILPGAAAHAVDRPQLPAASYEVGFFGDVPYGPEGRADYVNLLADMNRRRLAFAVHIGDIKGGGERCDDPVYTTARQQLDQLRTGVVYTPGDNEWTDCDRDSNGPYDPYERLDLIRKTFYPTDQTLGRRPFPVLRQNGYPENARWTIGPVTFAAVHVVGSNNNLVHDSRDGDPILAEAEYTARNAANLRWIQDTMTAAKADRSKGVMFFMHANPNFEGTDIPGYTTDGFLDTIAAFRTAAINNPEMKIAAGHGDTHYYRIDKPLRDGPSESAPILENFTRAETFGSPNTHWMSVKINPADSELFTFRQRIVAANIKPHTSVSSNRG